MKQLVFIFFVSAFSPAYSQTIPNKANLIKASGVTFSQLCNALLDSGYTILSKQDDIQQVTTDYKYYESANAAFKIVARVKDSVAYMRAYFTAPYSLSSEPLWKDDRAFATVNKKGEMKSKTFGGYPIFKMMLLAKSISSNVYGEIETP